MSDDLTPDDPAPDDPAPDVPAPDVLAPDVPASPSSTTAVHGGRGDLRDLGVHAPPIDLSTTYPFQDLTDAADSLEALSGGAADADEPMYARLHNPTVARCETGVAELEGADHCVAYGSGMAAMTAVFMAARQIGRHIVAVRPLYGTTDHLLSSGLLDVEVTYTEPDAVGEALRPDTSLVVIETPANPTLDLVDIRAVSDQIPSASDVALMVDSTFAPPVLQRPLDRGADLSLHSATKFLGGHGDVIAGVVSTGDASWAERLRHVRVVTGGLLHPNAAYLLHRSLPTLPQRVERAQENASALAGRLLDDDRVSGVRYPGLTHGADLVQRQMTGPGTMVAFEMDTYESAREVLRGVDLITAAVSLGSVDTLLQHPASLTHGVVDEETKAKTGITPQLLRLSVGLEAADDLWEDLSAALGAAVPTEATTAA